MIEYDRDDEMERKRRKNAALCVATWGGRRRSMSEFPKLKNVVVGRQDECCVDSATFCGFAAVDCFVQCWCCMRACVRDNTMTVVVVFDVRDVVKFSSHIQCEETDSN